MQTLITGQQLNLGDNYREYAEKALDNTVSKYFEEAVSADVRVAKEGAMVRAEITVHPQSGALIRASGVSSDAYAAFDEAAGKIARQLRKYKNKLVDRKNQVVEVAHMAVIESSDTEEQAGDAPVIIAEMQTNIPVCTVSAAVMQMDLEGLPALLFKNVANGSLNMVYRRSDNNIGWVNPTDK